MKILFHHKQVSNNASQIIENSSNVVYNKWNITTRNFDDVKSVFMNSPNTGADFTAEY